MYQSFKIAQTYTTIKVWKLPRPILQSKFENCLRISETDFVISDIDSSKVEVSITSGAIVVQHFIGVWGKNLKFYSITTARTTHLSNAPNYLKLQIVKKSAEQ